MIADRGFWTPVVERVLRDDAATPDLDTTGTVGDVEVGALPALT
ncbi:hypothetical protein SAMN03159343_3492 [Klenkia marina]|uniref:Uncharacterized protein n=1 Tax=Klenkia marina TaxID=1960309 RepID=A0A1G4YTF5_9ACTN|nr:hypothetical protein [Klenkia marina]SCX56733.1 hypothetical protein SAMN03159343_3492 [Klenkia marina]